MQMRPDLVRSLAKLTECPACPRCGTRMQLARVEPDQPDHNLRTYECPACQRLESMQVRYKQVAA